ncbi:MAG TPA: hypothetical protein PK970_08510 [Hyphomicrobiaceae bacterium]|mgnify:CR=1 FL=1|nr:hypothetical protein [Hyphomicrobiaceae bacterium]
MTGLAHTFALAGPLALVAAIAASIATRAGLKGRLAGVASAAAAVVALVPVGGTSLVSGLLGFFDTLSMTTILLLSLAIVSLTTGRSGVTGSRHDRAFIALVLLAAAIVLYPSTMGLLSTDIYAIGFGGFMLPAVLGVMLAYAAYNGLVVVPATIGLALAAWLLAIGESRNLWDYLLDPVAVVVSIMGALRRD